MSIVSTTSLKLTEEIKQQATNAAKELGMTPHAFMVEAIKQASINAEIRRHFIQQANIAREGVIKNGKVFESDKVFEAMKARIAGKKSTLKVSNW
jgi:predicted transcriptional regulator